MTVGDADWMELEREVARGDVDEVGVDTLGLPLTDAELETLVIAEPLLVPLELLANEARLELCIVGEETAPEVGTETEIDPLLVLQLKVDMLRLKLRLEML